LVMPSAAPAHHRLAWLHTPLTRRRHHGQVLHASSLSKRVVDVLSHRATHRCSCVRFAVASTLSSPVHQWLCCALRHLSAQGLCPVDWVFVTELPLPVSSLSHAPRSHPSHCH
jgi:hypothetical protein